VNDTVGLYEPFPDTDADPTDVPPEEQSVGAEACGPNTVNVTVSDGEAPADSTADTDEAEIAVPAVPVPGALTEPNAGDAAPTTVSAIDPSQLELAKVLF
jgi:hypothetical protein